MAGQNYDLGKEQGKPGNADQEKAVAYKQTPAEQARGKVRDLDVQGTVEMGCLFFPIRILEKLSGMGVE